MNISNLLPVLPSIRGHANASPEAFIAENQSLQTRKDSMTAVFTGATHGIGLATLQAFLKHIPKPRAFIIGRSRSNFAKHLQALQQLNPHAELIFIEAQLSLIRDIDKLVDDDLKTQLPPHSIDLLCMSQGYAPLGERVFTSEGLDESMTLVVYGRIRLADRLASDNLFAPNARIVSVGGGGKEGHLFENDLELRENYSMANLRGHFITIMTLAFDMLAKETPSLGFVHVYPGTVSTGLLSRGNGSFVTKMMLKPVEFLTSFSAMTAEESGERTLWAATAEKFVEGSYSINYDGALSESEKLAEYRSKPEVTTPVWNHLHDLFDRAIAAGKK